MPILVPIVGELPKRERLLSDDSSYSQSKQTGLFASDIAALHTALFYSVRYGLNSNTILDCDSHPLSILSCSTWCSGSCELAWPMFEQFRTID
ncbi:hypothetical protein KIN20_026725 [Parelaphostrongylus tenuis]|uniref:Uncharacterized protein n=1 Tax=Parelaphostrongylus tenuis TaxID=148309 RepID=A0AAD5WDA8_PARTN|nr:hypothetical protein KIN20_026725 [Parelaphostrongylus tenuis]